MRSPPASSNPFDDDDEPPKSRTNPFAGADDLSDDDDSVDLDSALSSMDIDKDFNLWASFRKSQSIRLSTSTMETLASLAEQSEKNQDEKLTQEELEDIGYWKKERLSHEEYFSHRYKPDPAQKKEMKELSRFLGISTSKKSLFGGGTTVNEGDPAIQTLFNTTDPPLSIIMKRGPILCNNEERELILLSHGFILAKVVSNEDSSSSCATNGGGSEHSKKSRRMDRSFDTCELYTSVIRVSDHWQDHIRHVFSIHTSNKAYIIQCSTAIHKRSWLDALERVVVQDRLHANSKPGENREIGWQHALIQTSLHSAAVTGDDALLAELWLVRKNTPDEYHHFTPLHYAALKNHVDVLEFLLENGAYVEMEDEDGRTPIYYAHRDGFLKAEELLLKYGAGTSKKTIEEETSELFREAAEFNIIKKERQQQKEESERLAAQEKADNAKGAMGNAMNAMHERGQKIDELGNKTTNLQDDARNYRDMARELKERSKQKKWYHL